MGDLSERVSYGSYVSRAIPTTRSTCGVAPHVGIAQRRRSRVTVEAGVRWSGYGEDVSCVVEGFRGREPHAVSVTPNLRFGHIATSRVASTKSRVVLHCSARGDRAVVVVFVLRLRKVCARI